MTDRIRRKRAGGLSLLEVVLAMSILAGSVVLLTQLVCLGLRAAGQTRDLTQAHILAESLMSEMTAGIAPPEPLSPTEIEPGWFATVLLQPTLHQGIVQLTVIVEEDSMSRRAARYQLSRWIRDPALELPTEMPAAGGEESSASSAGGGGPDASASPPPGDDGSTPPIDDPAAAGRRGRGSDARRGDDRGGGDARGGRGDRGGRGGQSGRGAGRGRAPEREGGGAGRGGAGRGGGAPGRGIRGGGAGRGGARGSGPGPAGGRTGGGRGAARGVPDQGGGRRP